MKKLLPYFLIMVLLFTLIPSPSYAVSNYEYQISYSPNSSSVSFKIYHESLFKSKDKYVVKGKLNDLNTNFKTSVSGNYLIVKFTKIKKGANNRFAITISNKSTNKAYKTISESLYINKFNSDKMYFFFNPAYNTSKQQLTFSTYVKKKNKGKYPVRVSINGELSKKLSFLSEKKVSGTDVYLQKYAVPLSGNGEVLIHHTSSKSSKVTIKKLVINPGNGEVFEDVEKSHWAYKTIKWSKDIGYSVGGLNGLFYPFQEITRAEAATLIARLMNADNGDEIKSHSFKDIKGHWAEHNIAYLASKDIISGYSNGKFEPDAPITRAETAAIISNYLIYNNYPYYYRQNTKKLKDVKGSDWFGRSVDSLYAMKILSGYVDNTFRPNNNIVRAEFISMIKNLNNDIYISAIK